MSKKTNEEIIQTNPYWPGCHIIDGRDKKKNVSSENGSHFKHLYKPLSVQNLDEAFGDDSEAEMWRRYIEFCQISFERSQYESSTPALKTKETWSHQVKETESLL